MTRDEAVVAAGPYYHAAPVEVADKIIAEGLLPSSEIYGIVDCVELPIVCVAPRANRHKYLNTIAWKSETHQAVLFEIATDTILMSRYDLDCTNIELDLLKERLGSNDFGTLLLAGADLMIYDAIPSSALKRVPIQDSAAD